MQGVPCVPQQSRSQHAAAVAPAARRGGAPLTGVRRVPASLSARVSCPRRCTRPRVTPNRGGAASQARRPPAAFGVTARGGLGPDGVTGSAWAMAQLQPPRSRAMATVPPGAWLPRAPRRRSRCPSRPGAVPRRAWRLFGCWSRRRCRWRRTGAGDRAAPAPAPSARRAGGGPAGVIEPGGRGAPGEESAGIRPRHGLRSLGGAPRRRAPMAATRVTAPVHGRPRRASRASPPGGKRPAGP
jgi:hypothetical protein